MGIVKKKGKYVNCTFCDEPIYRMQSRIKKYNFCRTAHRVAYARSDKNIDMGKGWKHTPEEIEQIRQASLNRNYDEVLTDESRRKMAVAAKNKVWADESREKLRQANLGKTLSEEVKQKIKDNAKYGKDNIMYKDDDASYQAKHMWIFRRKGKPAVCIDCGVASEEKIIQWSNKDHIYQRNEDDYKARCVSCHRKYDIAHNNYKVFNRITKK